MAQLTIEQAMQFALDQHRAGQLRNAESVYRQVLAIQPEHPDALHLLGVIAGQEGHFEEAAILIRRAIAAVPTNPAYHYHLGNALRRMRQTDKAVECYRRAITLKPNDAELRNELGTLLAESGQFDQAVACFRKALEINPAMAGAYNNLGNVFYDLGEIEKAESNWRRAIELNPNLAEAHFHLSLILLTRGEFESGFREHDWRWKIPAVAMTRSSAVPLWNGEDLAGKRVLIWGEQGIGDVIQFVRYLPMVAEQVRQKPGGKIILACAPELIGVFKSFETCADLTSEPSESDRMDFYCPIVSLPRIFKTTVATIPATIPYLRAEPDWAAKWKARLAKDRPNIGLVWAGRAENPRDKYRSILLNQFAPLTATRARWISLQKGPAATQVKTPPPRMELIDWTDELADFGETAALIENLDLVITIDSAVAHLAGAMGKPVWVLIAYVPDWRWQSERIDSPWYPTMRLFRQPALGDWRTPIAKVASELRDYSGKSPLER
jgi:tetratricopeptide (TPR) repeat protein